jgi:hypothetical protein
MSDIDLFANTSFLFGLLLAAVLYFWYVTLPAFAVVGIVGLKNRRKTFGKICIGISLMGCIALAFEFVSENKTAVSEALVNSRDKFEDMFSIPFFRSKDDYMFAKVQRSPVGSDCMKLIGQSCKCGPFILQDMQMGEPLAKRAYELRTSEGTKRGCSGTDGDTISMTLSHTGPCEVVMLPEVESEKSCGASSGIKAR